MKHPKGYLVQRNKVWYAYYYDEDEKYMGKSLKTEDKRAAKRKLKELLEVLGHNQQQKQLFEMYEKLILHHPELVVQPEPDKPVEAMSREELLEHFTRKVAPVQLQTEWTPPLILGKSKKVPGTTQTANMSVDDFWTAFSAAREDRVSNSTIKNYGVCWKNFITLIHPNTLSQITPESIRRFVGLRREKDIKESSLHSDMISLQTIMKWAIEEGYYTESNPVVEAKKKIIFKREAKKEIRALSEEQLNKCLEIAKDTNRDVYLSFAIAAYSGCRITEVGSLRWEDSINFEANTLTIKPRKKSKGISESDVKTDSSQRTIRLFPQLKDILLEYKQDFGYIIYPGRKIRHPFDINTCTIKKFKAGLGLKWFSFHTLRHTFVSLLLQQGVPLVMVSKLVGHSNVQITFDTYFHLDTKSLEGISLTNGISPK